MWAHYHGQDIEGRPANYKASTFESIRVQVQSAILATRERRD